MGAHPHPGEAPARPPGAGRPDLRAKDPALAAADAAHQSHAGRQQRANIAAAIDHLLNEPPPRPVPLPPEGAARGARARRARRAVEAVGAAASGIDLLEHPAFEAHRAAVVASHPEGAAALAAALAEARRRLAAAAEVARAHVAGLPDGVRQRAEKLLARELRHAGVAFAAEAPLSFTPWAQFAFCPTGPGGGVDPTCGKGGGKGDAPAAGARPATRREASQVLRAAKQAAKQAHDLSYGLPRGVDEGRRLRDLADTLSLAYRVRPDKAYPGPEDKKGFADRAADARALRVAAMKLASEYANVEARASHGESVDAEAVAALRGVAAAAYRAEKAFARLAAPKSGAAQFAFCPTGPGGGVDPTCGKGGGKASPSGSIKAGDTVHAKETLYVPVKGLEHSTKEVFAHAGEPLSVTGVYPNGMVEVKNAAGRTAAQPPGLFREFRPPARKAAPFAAEAPASFTPWAQGGAP